MGFVLGFNCIENYYIASANPKTVLNYYSYAGGASFIFVKTQNLPPYTNDSNSYDYINEENILTKSQLAIYSLQEYVNSINNAFVLLYNEIKSVSFVPEAATPPFITVNWETGYISLNYDTHMLNSDNGIFVNDALLRYMIFRSVNNTIVGQLSNKYILTALDGIQHQSKASFFKLNTIDKFIVTSTMSIIGDQTGTSQQTITFTDLDINKSDPVFLNMSGSFIYDAILMRNYTLQSNQGMRIINYAVNVRYTDKTELPFFIPPLENISIKFMFSRVY